MKKLFGIKQYLTFILLYAILITSCMCTMGLSAGATSNIERKHSETKAKIQRLKILESKETNKLYRNQQKLETTTKDLAYSQKQYTYTKERLNNIEIELSVAVAEYNKTLIQVRQRVRNIFKHHRKNLFELIISSEDINSLMDNIYFQNVVTKADKLSLYNVRNNARRIAQIRYQQELEKRRLANSIQDMNSKKRAIQIAIGRNEELIKKLKTDRHTYERTERELAKNSKNLTGMINRQTASSNNMKVAGGFIKPISGRITSPYGWRVHPIFKSRTFHSGIDIGGPFNGAVQASNSGKVIYVGWYGGYGKVVIIDHGLYNGAKITTLYAHLNSWNVKVGQYVSRGQVVGREGSTGYSTGPHVHFEVRVNGQTKNPLNYI